jgi:hypothetical protein
MRQLAKVQLFQKRSMEEEMGKSVECDDTDASDYPDPF